MRNIEQVKAEKKDAEKNLGTLLILIIIFGAATVFFCSNNEPSTYLVGYSLFGTATLSVAILTVFNLLVWLPLKKELKKITGK